MAQTFLLTLILFYGLSLTDKKKTCKHGIKDITWSSFYLFSFISHFSSVYWKLCKSLNIPLLFFSWLFVHTVSFAFRLLPYFIALLSYFYSDLLQTNLDLFPVKSSWLVLTRMWLSTAKSSPSACSASHVEARQTVFFSSLFWLCIPLGPVLLYLWY